MKKTYNAPVTQVYKIETYKLMNASDLNDNTTYGNPNSALSREAEFDDDEY